MTAPGSAARPTLTPHGAFAVLALLGVTWALSWPLPRVLSPFDVEPWVTASAWSALTVLGAVGALALRFQRLPRGAALGALVAIAWILSSRLGRGSEALESSRALLTIAGATSAFVLATTLDTAERWWLVRGLTLTTLLHGLPMLLGGLSPESLAGTLQNTGYANQILVPGAAAGAWAVTRERGAWRLVSAAALVVGLTHSALAPTLLGALAIGLACGVAALRSESATARKVLIAASIAGVGVLALRSVGGQDAAPAADSTAPTGVVESAASGDLGGVAVRRSIWGASLGMLADGGPFGFGPGRFGAAFPPYRDSTEARASDFDGALGVRTEVEHPHNDWLAPWIDTGWLGGLTWLLLLGTGAAAAWSALTREDVGTGALATAATAVLVNAGAHCNLTFNPLAATLGAACLGACVGTFGPLRAILPRWPARIVALGPLLALLAAPLTPLAVHASGSAFARYVETSAMLGTGSNGASLVQVTDLDLALTETLDASRQSHVLALQMAVADARGDGAPVTASEFVDRLAELRPHSATTLELAGLVALDRGDLRAARDAYEALERSRPSDASVRFNLARIELQLGRSERGVERVQAAHGLGLLDSERIVALARDAQLGGWIDPRTVAEILDTVFENTDPDALFERASLLRDQEQSPVTRAALECLAQHLWAREHADGGDFATAARVYRQAWRASQDAGRPGSPLIRMEAAAAERLSGNEPRAEALLEGLTAASLERAGLLPDWARVVLSVSPR